MLLILLCPLAETTPCVAQKVRFTLHGPSWHINSQNDNGWTLGAGSEMAQRKESWRYGALAGADHNSIWNTSLYVGVAGSYEINDWVGIGLCTMAATGHNREVCYDRSRPLSSSEPVL